MGRPYYKRSDGQKGELPKEVTSLEKQRSFSIPDYWEMTVHSDGRILGRGRWILFHFVSFVDNGTQE